MTCASGLSLALLAALVTSAASTAMTNGEVLITPTTLCTAGLAVTNMQFTFDTHANVANTEKISITASVNIWAGTGSVTCTATQEGSAFTAFTTATTSQTVLEITANSAGGIPGSAGAADKTYVFICTDNFAAITPDGTAVTFSMESDQDTTALANRNGWTPGGAITSPSMSNNPAVATPTAGTSPTDFSFIFTLPTAATDTNPLIITGSQSWLDTGTAGNPTCVWSPAPSPAPVCVKTSALILTCTPNNADAIDAAQATTLTVSARVKYHSATSTAQHFTLQVGSATPGAQVPAAGGNIDSVLLSTEYTTAASGGAVSGDPVTYFGNTRTEFFLPLGVLTPVMEVPDMHIIASAFEGSSPDEQWMDRILVKTPSGELIADISIKRDLLNFDRRNIPRNSFETLDVVMWEDRPTPLKVLPPSDAYFPHSAGVTITFTRAGYCPDTNATARIPCRECASVFGQYVKFLICATSAHEYFKGGYGAYKYAHLDFDVFDVDLRPEATSHYGGVLPEIWGLTPMSNATRGMIKSQELIEEPVTAPLNVTEAIPESAVGVGQYYTMKETTDESAVGECTLSSCKAQTSASA